MPSARQQRPGARRSAPPAWTVAALGLTVLGAVAVVPSVPSPATAATTSASVGSETSTPFAARSEGYYCFRIPSLVTTRSGALLAFAEGRVDTCSDIGHNDIVMKKSTDGGRTWGPLTVVAGANDDDAHGNPSPVVDAVTGRVSLLYATSDWSQNPDGTLDRGARSLRVAHSIDEGAGWQNGASLAHLKSADWGWVSTGPGHGIQLSRGAHHGRLVVTGDHTTKDGKAGGQLYYSDDGGLTWALGARSDVGTSTAHPAEPAVVETTDGGLYVNARSSARCNTNEHRLAATSSDGGATFAAPFAPVPNLDTAPVYGSLLRMSAKDMGGARDRILFSAPARLGPNTLEDRRELAVRSSYDEGKTWQTVGTVVTSGRAGYSDLTLSPTGAIGVLYENAGNIPHGNVSFTSFTETQMDAAQRELRLPRTSDTGPNNYRNHAVIHGGAQLTDRGAGKAMAFDGQDDYLRIVNCSPSLRLGQGDFTVAAWFKHSATSGGLPIVWGYGMGDKVRQFWLKAEPGKNRLRAAISTGDAYAEVATTSSYNDGNWHHVVFKRQNGQLVLSVDGGQEFTAAAPAGDITPPGDFSIHVGARPDFPDQPVGVTELFNGGLDDVRIFGRGLTTDEATSVRGGALDVANDQERLRLGFSTIW
ncbi:sialidase family protein [Streptomyces bambusae]|uniref:exo-alpha-sialidase n=1 Tax=Streptomyces bambusae TaxID=1550616 RepID=A0ABS6Z934_9ACTN|nr:sialidase family protein [Streptomyces bambusae]MBW5484264.1 sialidase [Streptomyces bambusae]